VKHDVKTGAGVSSNFMVMENLNITTMCGGIVETEALMAISSIISYPF
jgi:hypothetical protein